VIRKILAKALTRLEEYFDAYAPELKDVVLKWRRIASTGLQDRGAGAARGYPAAHRD